MKEGTKKVKLLEPLDVNKIAIEKDQYFHDAYLIDLPLDSMPDHVWLDFFTREWKASRHLWDRKLFVIGDKLRLVTTAYDLEDKIDWIKQVVERTNENLEKYSRAQEGRRLPLDEQVKKQIAEKEEEEKARIEAIRSIIRKKFGTA